ncbi:MAG: hypothetical protein JWL64_308 [Frankiales bacterium]|nr:hypothetical protein [Frankiales bacterium]
MALTASRGGEGTDGARRPALDRGPGRLLVAVYGLFAIAATSRALVQLIGDFHEAPVPYLLSLLSGTVYLAATYALARDHARLARGTILVELVGVLVVGTVSLVDSADFPDDTVWSVYGAGYGFIPLVLPFVGLLWLRRATAPAPER